VGIIMIDLFSGLLELIISAGNCSPFDQRHGPEWTDKEDPQISTKSHQQCRRRTSLKTDIRVGKGSKG